MGFVFGRRTGANAPRSNTANTTGRRSRRVAYAGFVHVAAPDTIVLDKAADVEQLGVHLGVSLRALDTRHGIGWVTSLPLGRTLAGARGRPAAVGLLGEVLESLAMGVSRVRCVRSGVVDR